MPASSFLSVPGRLYSMELCNLYALLWDLLDVPLLKPLSLAAD